MDEPRFELVEPLDFEKIPVQALEAALAGYIPYKWITREELAELYPTSVAHNPSIKLGEKEKSQNG